MPVWSVAAAIIVVLAVLFWRRRRLARPAERPAPTPRRLAMPAPAPLGAAPQQRSRMSAISDVDDPVTAAATLIHVVTGPVGWPRIGAKVFAALAAVTDRDRASDAIMFAEWAVRQGLDEHRAIDALAATLCRYLGKNELGLVLALLDDAAAAGGPEAEPYADHAKSQLVAIASS